MRGGEEERVSTISSVRSFRGSDKPGMLGLPYTLLGYCWIARFGN